MIRSPRGLLPMAVPVLIALVLLLFPACSSNLQMSNDTPSSYLLALRADYLAANPDGPFNEYVKRGEVIRGMDVVAVLASWGHPARRVRSSDLSELWVYDDIDEASKDRTEYRFVFRNATLSDWQIDHHISIGGNIDTNRRSGEVLSRGRTKPGKRVPDDF